MNKKDALAPRRPPPDWRRRLAVTVVAFGAAGVVFRLAVILALPPVIRHVAAHYGLTAQYEQLELYLLNGDVGIWHFSLKPGEGGPALVQSDYMRCHISTLDLFRGRLTVRRLEAEGVDLLVERKADGTVPLLQRFAQWTSPQAPWPSGPSNSLPARIDLTSPLEIDAFRLSSVHTRIIDEAVTPPISTEVDLNLRLTDVDSTIRPTQFEMDLTAAPLLDLLHVQGYGTARGKSLQAVLQIQAKGLHPSAAAGYLLPMGIRPTSDNLVLSMNARVSTTAAARPNAIAATAALDGLSAIADGRQCASIDKIIVKADAIDFTTAQIAQVIVDGGSCVLRRDADGEVGVAGLQVVQPQVLEERLSVPLAAALDLIPRHWGIGELSLRNLRAAFHDQSVAPAADLALDVDDLTVSDFSPDRPDAVAAIRGRCAAPGIADSIRLDGHAQPFAATKQIDLQVVADGIRPDAIRPYLDTLGLESNFSGGVFTAAFHADVTPSRSGILTTNAKLSNVALDDQGKMFSLNSAIMSDAAWDPAAGRLRIKDIEISGPNLATGRQVSGAMAALGLRTKVRPSQSSPILTIEIGGAAAPAPAPKTEYVFSIPKLQIDRFAWKDVGVQFDDLAMTPSTSLAISDAGMEMTNLSIDFDPRDAPGPPGKLHAWLNAPNLVDSVVVDGLIYPHSNGMSADLSVDGNGVTADTISRYFQNDSIQPIVRRGAFHLAAHLAVSQTSAGVRSTVAVKDFTYKDGLTDLLAVDGAEADGISPQDGELKIQRVAVDSPRLSAWRDADGSVRVAGVRIQPRPPTVAHDRLAQVYNSPSAAVAASNGPTPELMATLAAFNLNNATLEWTDQSVVPPASAHLTLSGSLHDAVFGKPAPPATLSVSVHEDHCLDRLSIIGLVTPSLDSPSALLEINAQGIRAGSLGAYAGPNARVNLQDGRFHAAIDAAMRPSAAGGFSGHLLVSGLEYGDGTDASCLCRLDALRLAASRIDAPGKTIAIDEIGLDGLEANAARAGDGTIRLLGLTLGASSGVGAALTPAQLSAPQTQVKAVGIANLAALAETKYPLVTIRNLDIGVNKISMRDESRPDAAPLIFSGLRLSNRSAIELLGDNPQTCPPVDLDLSGAVDPLIGSMNLRARLTPFGETAQGAVDLDLSHIRGSGVTDLFPELKSALDGRSLTDGRLQANLLVQVKRQGLDPLDTDFSKDFGLDFTVKNVEFRDSAAGGPVAGLDEVTSENIRVQPKTQTVTVPDLEFTNPSARVFRDAAGIHILGLIVNPAALPGSSAGLKSASSSTGEMTIDKLLVSGLDFKFEDRICSPPLVVPLTGLDVEVRGLTSRLAEEDKSCRFNVILNSGKVALPRRLEGNKLAGAVRDAFSAAAAKSADAPAGLEQRDLFSQAEATGIIHLYPKPSGWVKSSISGLDLAALKSEAKLRGISLSGGTFDGSVDLRLNGDGDIDARTRLVLTDLELSEPANGPIVRYLNLGAPLDVVIAALQDQDGSITLPIDVPIRSGHVSGGDIALAATGAAAGVIATAVATTPLKASDTVLAIFGNEKLPKNERPVTLEFDPADPSLNPSNVLKLRSLLSQAADDDTLELTLHQQFGGGDVLRAAGLANPNYEQCLDLARGLRMKKIELLFQRQAAAARARAEIASGFGPDAGEAIQSVRDIDLALARTEDALDEVYNRLRPGADRQADRRTRAACLEIGQDRLTAVRAALLARGISGLEQRIKLTHATFNPTADSGGGEVVIVLTHAKGQ